MNDFGDASAKTRLADLRREEEEKLMQALAPQYGFEYVQLRGYTINPEALMLVSENSARTANAVVFDKKGNTLSVAIHSPRLLETQELIKQLEKKGYGVRIFMVSTGSLEHAFARYQDQRNTTAEKRGILDINPEDIKKRAASITKIEDVKTALESISTLNSPRQISETLELVFAGALALKASDVHLEPEELSVRLRYRLDGVLVPISSLNRHLYGRMLSRLKLLSGMTINQRQEAQDGRFQFVLGEREIEVRSSIIPGAAGESIVMRLLDPGVASFSMDRLKLNPQLATIMEEQLRRPNGLIITTGPTGSGKTTALYAFLRQVHDNEKKIITIENPVEYKLEGIVQTQVEPHYTFADGLRAILRQDPDVIMVGEIRDRDVAETAIHAAQTGHLVFSTLHTNSAAGGFPRLIDLGVNSQIIGSAINIMLGQRLVRVLCETCREAYVPDTHERELLTRLLANYPGEFPLPESLTLYREHGCEVCAGTGFKGRVGIFEAIIVDEAVEEVVIRDPREHIILEAAKPQAIPTMPEDGARKVVEGLTSLAELARVIDLSDVERAMREASAEKSMADKDA